MLASVGIIVSEKFHPLFNSQVQGPAIYYFQEIENIFPPFWYLILLSIGVVEAFNISKGWEEYDPSRSTPARLKENYITGTN